MLLPMHVLILQELEGNIMPGDRGSCVRVSSSFALFQVTWIPQDLMVLRRTGC